MITIPTYSLSFLLLPVVVIAGIKFKKKLEQVVIENRRLQDIRLQRAEEKYEQRLKERKEELPGVWFHLWKEMNENSSRSLIIFDSFMFQLNRQKGHWEKVTRLSNDDLIPEIIKVSRLMTKGANIILEELEEEYRVAASKELAPYTSSGIYWHQI